MGPAGETGLHAGEGQTESGIVTDHSSGTAFESSLCLLAMIAIEQDVVFCMPWIKRCTLLSWLDACLTNILSLIKEAHLLQLKNHILVGIARVPRAALINGC